MDPVRVVEGKMEATPGVGVLDAPDAAVTERASASLQRLMAACPEYAQLLTSMVTFRRCYSLAYARLQELLARENPPADAMVEDLFVQIAIAEASEGFQEHQIVDSLGTAVLPWLYQVLAEHAERAKPEEIPDAPATEIYDGIRGIPLRRDRSLVLAGPCEAVRRLLDQTIITPAVKNGATVAVLDTGTLAPRRDGSMLVLPAPAWRGCADSPSALTQMARMLFDYLQRAPDLLVCLDLTIAYTRSYVGRPAGAAAGDAHKGLRKLADSGRSAFIGAVDPESMRDTVNLQDSEWEQLRTFTDLYSVHPASDGQGCVCDNPGRNQPVEILFEPGGGGSLVV